MGGIEMNKAVYQKVLAGGRPSYEPIIPNPLDEIESLRAERSAELKSADADNAHYRALLRQVQAAGGYAIRSSTMQAIADALDRHERMHSHE